MYTRSGHCASLLPDGRVVLVGGGDAKANLFQTAEMFDPVTQSFSTTGNLNQARTQPLFYRMESCSWQEGIHTISMAMPI